MRWRQAGTKYSLPHMRTNVMHGIKLLEGYKAWHEFMVGCTKSSFCKEVQGQDVCFCTKTNILTLHLFTKRTLSTAYHEFVPSFVPFQKLYTMHHVGTHMW